MEIEPVHYFTVKVNTEERGEMVLLCTPDNTTIYMHRPDSIWSDYDHFFYVLSEEELSEDRREYAGRLGAFITRSLIGSEVFDTIARGCAMTFDWTMVYRPEPTKNDRRSIEEQMQSMLSHELDEIDWEDFN